MDRATAIDNESIIEQDSKLSSIRSYEEDPTPEPKVIRSRQFSRNNFKPMLGSGTYLKNMIRSRPSTSPPRVKSVAVKKGKSEHKSIYRQKPSAKKQSKIVFFAG